MAADTKKVQTLVNIAADAAASVRAGVDQMKAARSLFQTVAPSTVGTPLAGGNAATLSAAIDRLDALINTTDAAIWTALIAAKVPTHNNEAL